MPEISEKGYKDEGVTRPFTRAPLVSVYALKGRDE